MDKTIFMKRVFGTARYTLTSEYGYRISPITGTRKFHDGEDYGTYRINCNLNSPVFGIVVQSEYHWAMGWLVKIKTPVGFVRMQHMKARGMAVGHEVVPGMKVGVAGSTGSSTGIHLHIAYTTLTGVSITPEKFMSMYNENKKYLGAMPTATVNVNTGTADNVGRWQDFLNWWGPNVTRDEDFGTDTEAKTKAFQSYYGLKPDGSVGTITRNAAKAALRC